MANELDERFPQGLSHTGLGCQDIAEGEEGEEESDPDHFQSLEEHILPPESRKTLVPNGGEELLDIGMSHKLYKWKRKENRRESRRKHKERIKIWDLEGKNKEGGGRMWDLTFF